MRVLLFSLLFGLLPVVMRAQTKMIDTSHHKTDTLQTITVTAGKRLVTRKADRYIINVENSYLADGNSGLDVLQKSPGIRVDANGTIHIKGNQSVVVMINDVVQRMSDAELADYLRTLRSEEISKIEVIPNPPAEYEASGSGGIIHIILKKARQDGLNGSAYTQYRQQGKDPFVNAGAMMDYKRKKLYLSGSYSFTKDNSTYAGNNTTIYPDKSILYNTTERHNNNGRYQYRAGIAYDISPTQSISIQNTGSLNRLIQSFQSDLQYTTTQVTTGTAHTDWVRKPWLGSTTLNYAWKIDTLGSALKFIADYTNSNKAELNTLLSVYNVPTMNSTFRTNTPSTTDMYSVQVDYTKALNKTTTVKGGAKYVQTNRNNAVVTEDYKGGSTWLQDSTGNDHFRYTESLAMLYTTAEKTMNHTNIKAGLRAEQTWSQGHSLVTGENITKNYLGLFPSLFIEQVFNEAKGNSLHLNYSRRLRRPAYNDLNPYRLQLHDYTILTGNPDLLPQYTHSLQAGYTWHHSFTADVYFAATRNFIAQLGDTTGNHIIEYKSQNFPNNTEYGISLSAPFTIIKGWNITNDLLLYHVSTNFNSSVIRQTAVSVKSIHTIAVPTIMDIDFLAEYESPYIVGNAKQVGILSMDCGFSRRILHNKGRLRLYVSDILNREQEKQVSDYNNIHIDFYQKRPTRTVSLSFNWNFNTGKAFIKKKMEVGNSESNRL